MIRDAIESVTQKYPTVEYETIVVLATNLIIDATEKIAKIIPQP